MAEFRMPSLGADMDSGVLLEWLVEPGAEVHKGDVVAVVDTDKAAVEVETFADGTVDRLVVAPGQRVPVGTVLATITAPGGAPGPVPAPAAATAAGAAPPPAAGPLVTSPLVRRLATTRHIDLHTVHGTGPGGRITREDVEHTVAAGTPAAAGVPGPAANGGRRRVSPLARRLAAELGVDVGAVTGTGRGGVVEAADVRRAAAARSAPGTAPAAAASTVDRTAAMRSAIAALMARSKREIPHYYLGETIDFGPAATWLRARNRKLPVPQRLVPAALLVKAAAVALRTVPELNGFWLDDHFVAGSGIHVGVAVSLRGGGLIAPAIHDAADLDLATLMARMRDLVTRARAGRLRRTELSDPTITVSNMGDQGVETIFGVIYPPQVALVGFGRIVDRPCAVDGLLGVRPTVTASLSGDHRATDGATGARYLQTIVKLLHKPEEL